MAFKFVAVFALLAVANAGFISSPQVYHAAPAAVVKTLASPLHVAAQHVYAKAAEEYDPHPQYKFGYGVQDVVSGDSKSQVEERDGDVVRGEYSLIDADGYKRTVQYTADPINGFNAVVNRTPLVAKAVVAAPAVVKTVAPVAHYAAAPAYTSNASPVHYAAAPAYTSYASPAHYAAAPAYSTYAAPSVVKTVAPVTHYAAAPAYSTYTAPSVVKTVAPVAHYAAAPAYSTYAAPAVVKSVAPAYTTYSAPATYLAHH